MSYTVNSPLIKTSGHYTAQQLYAAFEPMIPADQRERARIAIDWIVVLSNRFNLDELALCAILWIETGYGNQGLPFRHPNYLKENNLGNLGKTGDSKQDAEAQPWVNIQDAVFGLVAHYVGYAYGSKWRTVWNVDDLGKPQTWDKRFDLAINNTPNRAGVKTLGDLNRRWAIDRDDDYGGKLAERANALVNAMSPLVETPSTPPEPIPGEGEPMADPLDLIRPYLVEAPVYKQRAGQGYSVGSRNIAGLAEHETQGIMTGPQRQQFFSCPSGERCEDALVDYGIPRNEKKIYRFQDPFTSNRIPWASGGSAAAITQMARKAATQMGNPAGGVNAFYAAVEIEKNRGQPMTPDQIEMTARLLAYICAMNGYPANDWKYPDVLANNVPTSVNHSDLYTSTNCRINDDDRAKFEARCTELLTVYYAGATPVDPGEPTAPVAEIIPGLDYGVAARLFASVKGEDGVTYKFDRNGPVSKLWMERGKATGEWPALASVLSYESGARRYFVFEGGDIVLAAMGQAPRWLQEAA